MRLISIAFMAVSFLLVLLNDGGVYSFSLDLAVLSMTAALLFSPPTEKVKSRLLHLSNTVLTLWVAVVGFSIFQMLPTYESVANSAWVTLEQAEIIASSKISVVPGDTLPAIIAISLPFMTVLICLRTFPSDRQAEKAIQAFGLIGGFLAMVAVAQFWLFPTSLMFDRKESYLDSATLPFVNRNTAATFYGLVILSLLVSLQSIWPAKAMLDPQKSREARLFWFMLFAILAAIVALALTRSRAGIAASVISVCVFSMLTAWAYTLKKGSAVVPKNFVASWKRAGAYSLVVLAVITIVALGVFGRAWLRADISGADDARFCVYPNIAEAAQDNFTLGVGPGAFRYFFPAYRNPACNLDIGWFRAHSVYLDVVLAFGVFVGALFLLAGILLPLSVYRKGARDRKSKRPYAFAGLSAVLLVALHSIVDFSVQVPGFAMAYGMLIALTAIISLNTPGQTARKSSDFSRKSMEIYGPRNL